MAKAQVMDSIHITLGFILKGFTAREFTFMLLCIFSLLCVIMYFVCIIMYFPVVMLLCIYRETVPYLLLQRLTYQKFVGVPLSSFLFKFYKSNITSTMNYNIPLGHTI